MFTQDNLFSIMYTVINEGLPPLRNTYNGTFGKAISNEKLPHHCDRPVVDSNS